MRQGQRSSLARSVTRRGGKLTCRQGNSRSLARFVRIKLCCLLRLAWPNRCERERAARTVHACSLCGCSFRLPASKKSRLSPLLPSCAYGSIEPRRRGFEGIKPCNRSDHGIAAVSVRCPALDFGAPRAPNEQAQGRGLGIAASKSPRLSSTRLWKRLTHRVMHRTRSDAARRLRCSELRISNRSIAVTSAEDSGSRRVCRAGG